MTIIGSSRRTEMAPLTEGQRDVRSGQLIIVTARWILVAAGLVLALWLPGTIVELRTQLVVLIGLAMANFFLHAQLLKRRPTVDAIAYAASAADIGVITLLVWSQGGYRSDLYIFYLPALLALSLAFETEIAFGFGAIAVGLYGLIATATASQADTEVVIARLVMLAAVVVCGNMYRRIEQDRRSARTEMRDVPSVDQETAEDIFFGQVVLIWARWAVIVAGAVLVLWTASSSNELSTNIVFILALMGLNFFLHGRYLMERPANSRLVAIVTLIEVFVFTAIVVFWQGGTGIHSPLFIFYYPSLLAFALVFPPRVAMPYTVGAIGLYVLACFASDPTIVTNAGAIKQLVLRVVTLASVAGLATYYWRIQRSRRRASVSGTRAAPAPHASAAAT
jgi:hypothetical protein